MCLSDELFLIDEEFLNLKISELKEKSQSSKNGLVKDESTSVFNIEEGLLNIEKNPKLPNSNNGLVMDESASVLNYDSDYRDIIRKMYSYQSCEPELEDRILNYLRNEGSISRFSLKHRVIPNHKMPKDHVFLMKLREMEEKGLILISKEVVSLSHGNS